MASLYTILFSSGLIKVGMTTGNPKNRLATHAASLGLAHIDVVDYEFCKCPESVVRNAESLLIEKCKSGPDVTQKSKEWFYGLKFEDVTKWMQESVGQCTEKKNAVVNEVGAIDITDSMIYAFEGRALDVMRFALEVSRMDDETANIVRKGVSRAQREVMEQCWHLTRSFEDSGLPGDECVARMKREIAKTLCFNFVYKIL